MSNHTIPKGKKQINRLIRQMIPKTDLDKGQPCTGRDYSVLFYITLLFYPKQSIYFQRQEKVFLALLRLSQITSTLLPCSLLQMQVVH